MFSLRYIIHYLNLTVAYTTLNIDFSAEEMLPQESDIISIICTCTTTKSSTNSILTVLMVNLLSYTDIHF